MLSLMFHFMVNIVKAFFLLLSLTVLCWDHRRVFVGMASFLQYVLLNLKADNPTSAGGYEPYLLNTLFLYITIIFFFLVCLTIVIFAGFRLARLKICSLKKSHSCWICVR